MFKKLLCFISALSLLLLSVGCNSGTPPFFTEEHMKSPFNLYFDNWNELEELEAALRQNDGVFETAFSDKMNGDIGPETAVEMRRVYDYLKSFYVPILVPTSNSADYFVDAAPYLDYIPNGNTLDVVYRLGGSRADNVIRFSCTAYTEFPKNPSEDRPKYQDCFYTLYRDQETFVSYHHENSSPAYTFKADTYEGQMFSHQNSERYYKGYFITENTWVSVTLETEDEDHVSLFHSIFRDGTAPYALTVAPLETFLSDAA